MIRTTAALNVVCLCPNPTRSSSPSSFSIPDYQRCPKVNAYRPTSPHPTPHHTSPRIPPAALPPLPSRTVASSLASRKHFCCSFAYFFFICLLLFARFMHSFRIFCFSLLRCFSSKLLFLLFFFNFLLLFLFHSCFVPGITFLPTYIRVFVVAFLPFIYMYVHLVFGFLKTGHQPGHRGRHVPLPAALHEGRPVQPHGAGALRGGDGILRCLFFR